MKSDNENPGSVTEKSGWWISLDAWAVGFALTLALLIRLGVIKHISW